MRTRPLKVQQKEGKVAESRVGKADFICRMGWLISCYFPYDVEPLNLAGNLGSGTWPLIWGEWVCYYWVPKCFVTDIEIVLMFESELNELISHVVRWIQARVNDTSWGKLPELCESWRKLNKLATSSWVVFSPSEQCGYLIPQATSNDKVLVCLLPVGNGHQATAGKKGDTQSFSHSQFPCKKMEEIISHALMDVLEYIQINVTLMC